jgi:hypothetical protein
LYVGIEKLPFFVQGRPVLAQTNAKPERDGSVNWAVKGTTFYFVEFKSITLSKKPHWDSELRFAKLRI